MTTKDPSRKQIIIPISSNNSEAIILQANWYISNINYLLKDVKSEVLADFIHSINKGVIITTNKAAVVSDLSIIKKYIKGVKNIDLENISSPYLPNQNPTSKYWGSLTL